MILEIFRKLCWQRVVNRMVKLLHLVYLLCADLLQQVTHSMAHSFHLICHADLTFVQDRAGHDWRYAIDATKMNDKLNWQPDETFETGIRKTVAWYLASMLGEGIE